MTAPEFREPAPQGRQERRSRRQLTPEQAERRYTYLDTIDRRCDAHSRRCITAANVVIEATPMADGKPAGEQITLKSCTRHKRIYLYAPDRWQIISVTDLPPGEKITRAERNKRI